MQQKDGLATMLDACQANSLHQTVGPMATLTDHTLPIVFVTLGPEQQQLPVPRQVVQLAPRPHVQQLLVVPAAAELPTEHD